MNIYSKLKFIGKEHHLSRYVKLIEHYKTNPPIDDYETHHILPKSIFPEHKKDINNLVRLPLKAHFISHYLLHKIVGGKMTQAYFLMSARGGGNCVSYKKIKDEYKKILRNNNPNKSGVYSKIAWAEASDKRRKKQSEIMKANNIKHKSILCDFENLITGEIILNQSCSAFARDKGFSKSGVGAARGADRVYKNEWVIKTHSDHLDNKASQTSTVKLR